MNLSSHFGSKDEKANKWVPSLAHLIGVWAVKSLLLSSWTEQTGQLHPPGLVWLLTSCCRNKVKEPARMYCQTFQSCIPYGKSRCLTHGGTGFLCHTQWLITKKRVFWVVLNGFKIKVCAGKASPADLLAEEDKYAFKHVHKLKRMQDSM